MYSIRPVPKPYAWGSTERLQSMFGLAEDSEPLAEMWFSGHEAAPSMIDVPGLGDINVAKAIKNRTDYMIGSRASEEFGPMLPYLFKIISAQEPLSLQVHPLGFQARAGFNEENELGIPMDAPERSFKDINAKSEMVVALEPFQASVGFASRSFALKNLELVDHAVARKMVRALQGSHAASIPFMGAASESHEFDDIDAMMPIAANVWHESRKRVFRAFTSAVTAAPCDGDELTEALEFAATQVTGTKNQMAFEYAVRASREFAGDASVLALLMMNPLRLEQGESVFIPAGTPHAYIHGTGAEIMTNSDNVLRAGMTLKHKDIPHLLQCVECKSSAPIDPSDSRVGTLVMRDMVFYKPAVNEFMLVYGHVDAEHEPWPLMNKLAVRYDKLVQQISDKPMFPHMGPRVIVCTEGAVQVVTDFERRILQRGEAVFVPAAEGWAYVDPVADTGINGTNADISDHGSYVMASTPF